MSRTYSNVNFSEHKLRISKSGNCLIHTLAKPNTNMYKVVFINAGGVMTVTGDLGNWVFCREFHPSAEGKVSEGYWCEKIQLSSDQKTQIFSVEDTQREILETVKELLNDCCEIDDDSLDQLQSDMKEYVENSHIDNQDDIEGLFVEYGVDLDYIDDYYIDKIYFLSKCYTYLNDYITEDHYITMIQEEYLDDGLDFDDAVICYETKPSLKVIFDAFNYCCKLIKEGKIENVSSKIVQA